MFTIFKKTAVIALMMFFAIPAEARVTPAHKYPPKDYGSSSKFYDSHTQGGVHNEKEGGSICADKNLYSAKQSNAICSGEVYGDETCYRCECAADYKYERSVCNVAGLKPSGDSCQLGSTFKYKACECDTAGGYLSSDQFDANLADNFNTANAVIGGGVECYKLNALECKEGSMLHKKEVNTVTGTTEKALFTAKDDSRFLTYVAVAALKDLNNSQNIFCTRDVVINEPLRKGYLRPTTGGADECINMKGGDGELKTRFYPNAVYSYFTGCSTEGDCIGSASAIDCIATKSSKINVYNEATQSSKEGVTCRKAQECDKGYFLVNGKKFLCGDSSTPNTSYFTSEPVSQGRQQCRKVTGCASDYQLKYLANSGTPWKAEDDNTYTYDVQSLESGTGKLICAMPTGCRMDKGLYDFTAQTGCWGGWLALWRKNEFCN